MELAQTRAYLRRAAVPTNTGELGNEYLPPRRTVRQGLRWGGWCSAQRQTALHAGLPVSSIRNELIGPHPT